MDQEQSSQLAYSPIVDPQERIKMAAEQIRKFTSQMSPEQKDAAMNSLGVDPATADSATIKGASQKLEEVAKVAAKSKDPSNTTERITALMKPKEEETPEKSQQRVLASAMIAAIPTIAGYLLGGSAGGSAGAGAGAQALAGMQAREQASMEKREAERDAYNKSIGTKAAESIMLPEKERLHLLSQLQLMSEMGDERAKQALAEIAAKGTEAGRELDKKQGFQAGENEKDRALKEKLAREAALRAANKKDEKPPTEYQSKSGTFAKRMEQAEEVFQSLKSSGYNRATNTEGLKSTFLPEGMKPAGLKQQEQAERAFLSGIMRAESGAAISDRELAQGALQYFDRAGDDEQTLANKAAARRQALESMKSNAGSAYGKMPSVHPEHVQGGSPGRVIRDKKTGKMFILHPDQSLTPYGE